MKAESQIQQMHTNPTQSHTHTQMDLKIFFGEIEICVVNSKSSQALLFICSCSFGNECDPVTSFKIEKYVNLLKSFALEQQRLNVFFFFWLRKKNGVLAMKYTRAILK